MAAIARCPDSVGGEPLFTPAAPLAPLLLQHYCIILPELHLVTGTSILPLANLTGKIMKHL